MPSPRITRRMYSANARLYDRTPAYRAAARLVRNALRRPLGRPRGVVEPFTGLEPISRAASLAGDASGPFRLPAGYCERTEPVYFHCHDVGVVRQPDVYALTTRLGAAVGVRRIIDLGSGAGRHLHAASDLGWETIGVDYGPNIDGARERWPELEWREADLEGPGALPLSRSDLEGSVIVCADVIEHLRDPRPLLEGIAHALERAWFAVVSTPDRERTHGGPSDGPSPNRAHVREWTRDELAALMCDCGLVRGAIGWTRSDDWTSRHATTVAVLAGREMADHELGTLVRRARS